MAAPSGIAITCDEFLEFQESIKKLRLIDDRIIHALNTKIPTATFEKDVNSANQCKQLYEDLLESHKQRGTAINKCIKVMSEKVTSLREKRHQDPDNLSIVKELRKAQTNLRLMQTEVNVEEVVKDRSFKVFNERCRSVYKPPVTSI